MDQSLWFESLRAAVVLRALWDNRIDRVAQAIGEDALVVEWKHQPEAWPPSYALVQRGEVFELYIQGTSNSWQIGQHVKGVVGERQGWVGVVHAGFQFAGNTLYRELKDYLVGENPCVFYGHSYGGGAAQTLAQILVDKNKPPEQIRVVCLASPKVYNSLMGDPPHKVDLVANNSDPVPLLPPGSTPVYFWGWTPIPSWRYQPGTYWEYRGTEHWLSLDGEVSDDWWESQVRPGKGISESFSAHSFQSYREYLDKVAEKRGYPATPEVQALRSLMDEMQGNQLLSRTIPDVAWIDGMPPEYLSYPYFSTSSGSKENVSMANAVKCQVEFKVKGFGFSEIHHFYDSSPAQVPLATVEARLQTMLKARLKALEPYVIYGKHVEVDSYRITREDGSRESLVRYEPEIEGITGKDVNPPNDGGIEYPWTGMLCRLNAGAGITRTLIVRPVWNGRFLTESGETDTHPTLKARVAAIGKSYLAQGCWAIKAQDKAANPNKTVTAITPAPSPLSGTLLAVADHGYQPGDSIRVHGGDPSHKPYRGTFLVGPGTTEDSIHLVKHLTDVVVAGGCKVYRIRYGYFPITSFEPVRMRSRDTGNGIGQGRGRR